MHAFLNKELNFYYEILRKEALPRNRFQDMVKNYIVFQIMNMLLET